MEDSLSGSTNLTSGSSVNTTNPEVYVTPATNLRSVTVSQDVFTGLINTAAYLSIIVGIPGIMANILIIMTYVKMGITNSINASYTAMAVSDIGCVVTTIWFEILLMPQFHAWKALPFIPMEVLAPTAAYPNLAFAKITAWITAYISFERCLCVAFPHKVKLLFTKRLTVIILIIIAICNAIPSALVAVWLKFEWKISPIVPNKTVLGRVIVMTPVGEVVLDIQQWLFGVVNHWVPIGISVVCSIFLAIYLKVGSNWRQKSLPTGKSEEARDLKSSKEERIIQTVLTISVLSILLSTPVSINFIFTVVAPELSPFLYPTGIGTIVAAYATGMTMVNSCLNIFIYYRLGTKFRSALLKLLNAAFRGRLSASKTKDAD